MCSCLEFVNQYESCAQNLTTFHYRIKKPRTLKIKKSNDWISIYSDNHIRKSQRDWDSAVPVTVSEVDTVLEGKIVKNNISMPVNGKHSNVTLNDMHVHCHKIGLAKKRHDLIDLNRLCLQQRMGQLLNLKEFIRWQCYRHMHCIPKQSYKRKVLNEMKFGLEEVICTPKMSQYGQQKRLCLLTYML